MPSQNHSDVFVRPMMSVIEDADPPFLTGAARWSPTEGWSEVNRFNTRCDDAVV